MTLDLEALLRQFESPELEFKEVLPGAPTLTRLACAFANGRDGKLILGVRDEDRAVVGVDPAALLKRKEYVISTIHDHVQLLGATLNCSKTLCIECFRVGSGAVDSVGNQTRDRGAVIDEKALFEAAEVEP